MNMKSLVSTSRHLKTCGFLFRRFALLVAGYAGLINLASAAMTVGELRCEYALNPIGIDTPKPRLSWTLLDTERGQRQSAYQIRIADAPEDLGKENGFLVHPRSSCLDLWRLRSLRTK